MIGWKVGQQVGHILHILAICVASWIYYRLKTFLQVRYIFYKFDLYNVAYKILSHSSLIK